MNLIECKIMSGYIDSKKKKPKTQQPRPPKKHTIKLNSKTSTWK